MLIVCKVTVKFSYAFKVAKHIQKIRMLHSCLTGKICVTKLMLMLSTHKICVFIGTKHIQ